MSYAQVIYLVLQHNTSFKRLNMSSNKLYVSCLNKIITRLNNFFCRTNKLFILFKQDNNSFKRLILSFEQVILSCLNKITTRLSNLLSVLQLNETSRNVPKRTRTDRNGRTKLPKRTSVSTETDFTVYRNGAGCGFCSHRNEHKGYQKR